MPELLHILIGAQRGGCELNCLMVIRFLPHVRHRVLVLIEDGPMIGVFREAGAAVDILGMSRQTAGRRLIAALRDQVAQQPPDAVMIWHGLVWLPQMLYAYQLLGVPIGVHGGNPAHTMPRWVDWKFIVLRWRYPLRGQLPTYICCSQHVADSFDASGYLRRFPRVVVRNGVAVPPGPPHEPRPFDPEKPFVIGMLARLSRIKDHATLLRAFALVRQRYPNVVLELAGAGEEETRLRMLAHEVGVATAVRFLGEVADVYGRMRGWDLFAYATTADEGLGNAVAEAMMLGLPAVVTDIGPMRDFAGDGTAVVFTLPADPVSLAKAMTRLIPDVSERAALGRRGREWALANFHPSVFADRYAEILGLPQCDGG